MTTPHSIRQSKAVQRHTGLTFHLATRLLPERVRHPTYVLYAFFRTADEVVDAADPGPPATRRRELERLRAAALGERETDDPVLEAVADLYARHDIAREDVDAFVDAMLMDVETDRYRTHEQLDTYLRGSSVAVGHMMLDVMDPDEAARARPHAAALGEAFQLTNFLRDVREDVREYDRIYLPAATLRAHGSSHADVASLTPSDDVRAAIREELRRTERRYHRGVAGIRYLPADCRFPVLAAAVMYADQHRLIREREYDVLSDRPTLTLRRRLSLVARAWARWQFTTDPRRVFYRVTDIDPPADVGAGATTDTEPLHDPSGSD
jgi:phytoene synthase